MYLIWNRCDTGNWCPFNTVDLNHSHFDNMEGVYIIWFGQYPVTVDVGQGIIKDRIAFHRTEDVIQPYQQYYLYVTWASVPRNYRDGVERYLANTLNPKTGRRYPDVTPIEVNLPW